MFSAIPDGTGDFNDFTPYVQPLPTPSLDNEAVAFLGVGSQRGVYTDREGSLQTVADTETPIPGGSGYFSDFLTVSMDNGDVAFYGKDDADQDGLYIDFGAGVLKKVIAENDVLDGKTVMALRIAPDSLSGDALAFYVTFTDYFQAIYVATLCTD